MKFYPLKIKGAYLIEPELMQDERGFFARSYCVDTFIKNGLNPQLQQCNISFNSKKGTLRGMHYQKPPHAEIKIVRCTRGAIYDVILDVRKDSPTFKEWIACELTEHNHRMLYIPSGCAHGFQTLTDNSEVFYQMSTAFAPEYACGIKWNDSQFDLKWPYEDMIISFKDQSYPDFAP